MELYKLCINNAPYYFLVQDTTDNPLRFRNNSIQQIQRLVLIIDDKIQNENMQTDTN